jgi:lipopolysaccharide/colanic/teichoic acid biosynthesis glycosyltransferase
VDCPRPTDAAFWGPLEVRLPRSRYRSLRAVTDRMAAVVLAVLLSPLMAVIALAIRFDSGSPVLFRQTRAGRRCQPFTMLKFRTMTVDAPAYGRTPPPDAPSITQAGTFLRRTGLDELPQLWNVIRGDMSLIGPRPDQLQFLCLYEPWMHERHLVRPGLTGWWQVHHRDGSLLFEDVEKDLFYLHNQGPGLDLKVLVRTLRVLVSGLRRQRPGRGPEQATVETDTA